MCSELFRIPLEWLHITVAGSVTVGQALLGLLLLTAAALVARGWHLGKTAEIWGYLPGFFLLGLLLFVVPRMFPAGLPIRGYGVMMLVGLATALGLAIHRGRQQNIDPELLISLAFSMIVCGIVGARLFYVIEYWNTRFQFPDWQSTLIAIFKFTEGGLVVYGSLIGIAVAFVWFVRRHRLPALALADLITPGLVAALAWGRIGCLLNGCCYGGESNQPWAVSFPQESMVYQEQMANGRLLGLRVGPEEGANQGPIITAVDENSPAASVGLLAGMTIVSIDKIRVKNLQQAQKAFLAAVGRSTSMRITTAGNQSFSLAIPAAQLRSRPVHPTQIYSSIHAALLAWVLWSLYPFRTKDGQVFAVFLTVYPVVRFLLEIIRVDESAVFGTGLSISQNISLVLLMVAAIFWGFLSRRPPALAGFAALEHS